MEPSAGGVYELSGVTCSVKLQLIRTSSVCCVGSADSLSQSCARRERRWGEDCLLTCATAALTLLKGLTHPT